MFTNNWKKELCFLCLRNETTENLFHVESTLCPASKKTLLHVIETIASSSSYNMNLPNDTKLCIECIQTIVSFDEKWCTLLESIQKAMKYLNVDIKEENEICAPPMEENIPDPLPSYEQNPLECLNNVKVIPLDVIVKQEIISDPQTTADELKKDICEENKQTETLAFNPLLVSVSSKSNQKKETILNIPQSFRCFFCLLDFNEKHKFDEHIEQLHKKPLKYKCDKCNFAHENEYHFIVHKNEHVGLSDRQCPWCHQVFSSKRSVMRHMESHMNEPKYQCDKCGLEFITSTHFKNHKMVHDAEENPQVCSICKKRFKTVKTFRRHQRTHREDRPRYTCENCGKVFVDRYTLTKHLRLHITDVDKNEETTSKTKNLTPPNFNCIICSESFTDKPHLDKHMQDNHDVIIETSDLKT